MRLPRWPAGREVLAPTLAIALVGVGVGCEGPEEGNGPENMSDPTVRDSAGITVVENNGPVWSTDEGGHLSARPTLEIGSADEPAGRRFHRIVAGRRFTNGRIAIADGGVLKIQIFSPAGELVVAARADPGARGSGRDEGLHRDPMAILRSGPDGGVRDTIGVFPGPEYAVSELGLGLTPFLRRTVHAVSAERIFVGDQARASIEVRDPPGTLRRIVRLPGSDRTVTRSDARQWMEALLERRAGPEVAKKTIVEEYLGKATLPPTRPAYGEILGDPSGNLWVSEATLPGEDPGTWTVVNPDGILLGSVEMPERFLPLQIGNEVVLGRWRDPLEMHHLKMYRLEK